MSSDADVDEPGTRRPGVAWGPIACAVGATFLARGLVGLSRLDELELERYIGNFGWALLHGVDLDPDSLPIIPHLRGSVVFGVLVVPFLWLAGPTLLAVKALALTWSCLGAALLAGLTARVHGPRAALLAGAWFALAPPAFQMVDVLALGSHADTLPFLLALLWLGFATGRAPTAGRYLALGTALGAAAFFSMQLWVALPGVAAAWWVHDRRLLWRPRALLALLAAAPWLALIPLVTHSATLVNKPLESWLVEGGLPAALSKLGAGLCSEFPRSWLFGPVGAAWATWVLGPLVLASLLLAGARSPWRSLLTGAAWSPAQALRLYCLLHFATLFAAYSVSDFRVNLVAVGDGMGSRYFMPLVPAMAFLLVDLVRWLRGRDRRVAAAAVVGALASGLAGWLPLLRPAVGLHQPPVAATEFYAFGPHVPHAAGSSMAARLALLDRLEPDWGGFRALAQRHTFVRREAYDRESLLAELERVAAEPLEVRRFRYANLGAVMAEQTFDQLAGSPRFAIPQPEQEAVLNEVFGNFFAEALQNLEGDARRWFLRGAGRQLSMVQMAGIVPALRGGLGSADLAARIGFRLLLSLPAGAREPAVQGMGFQFGLRLTRYELHPPYVVAALDELPAPARRTFLAWAGRGFRLRFRELDFDPQAPLSVRALFSPDDWAWFERGLAAPARPTD